MIIRESTHHCHHLGLHQSSDALSRRKYYLWPFHAGQVVDGSQMKNWRAFFCVPMLLAHVPFQILALIYTVPFMIGQDSIQLKLILSKTEPYKSA